MPWDEAEYARKLDEIVNAKPETPSTLGSIWKSISTPIKGLVNIPGGATGALAGTIAPEAWEQAYQENLQYLGAEPGAPSLMQQAAALPGVGEVVARGLPESFKQSTIGRAVTPVGQIGLNILTDPLNLIPIAGAASKAGRAASLLRKVGGVEGALEAQKAATGGEAILKAAEALAAAQSAEKTLAGASTFQRGLAKAAEYALPGKTLEAVREVAGPAGISGLPKLAYALGTSPIPAVVYAPEIVQGASTGFERARQEMAQGETAAAVGDAAGAALTAGLGILMAKGLISEHHANAAIGRNLEGQKPAVPEPVPGPQIAGLLGEGDRTFYQGPGEGPGGWRTGPNGERIFTGPQGVPPPAQLGAGPAGWEVGPNGERIYSGSQGIPTPAQLPPGPPQFAPSPPVSAWQRARPDLFYPPGEDTRLPRGEIGPSIRGLLPEAPGAAERQVLQGLPLAGLEPRGVTLPDGTSIWVDPTTGALIPTPLPPPGAAIPTPATFPPPVPESLAGAALGGPERGMEGVPEVPAAAGAARAPRREAADDTAIRQAALELNPAFAKGGIVDLARLRVLLKDRFPDKESFDAAMLRFGKQHELVPHPVPSQMSTAEKATAISGGGDVHYAFVRKGKAEIPDWTPPASIAEDRQAVIEAAHRLDPNPGALIYIPKLRAALARRFKNKDEFDRAILRMGNENLQAHPIPSQLTPEEKGAMIPDGRGSYFMAFGLREPATPTVSKQEAREAGAWTKSPEPDDDFSTRTVFSPEGAGVKATLSPKGDLAFYYKRPDGGDAYLASKARWKDGMLVDEASGRDQTLLDSIAAALGTSNDEAEIVLMGIQRELGSISQRMGLPGPTVSKLEPREAPEPPKAEAQPAIPEKEAENIANALGILREEGPAGWRADTPAGRAYQNVLAWVTGRGGKGSADIDDAVQKAMIEASMGGTFRLTPEGQFVWGNKPDTIIPPQDLARRLTSIALNRVKEIIRGPRITTEEGKQVSAKITPLGEGVSAPVALDLTASGRGITAEAAGPAFKGWLKEKGHASLHPGRETDLLVPVLRDRIDPSTIPVVETRDNWNAFLTNWENFQEYRRASTAHGDALRSKSAKGIANAEALLKKAAYNFIRHYNEEFIPRFKDRSKWLKDSALFDADGMHVADLGNMRRGLSLLDDRVAEALPNKPEATRVETPRAGPQEPVEFTRLRETVGGITYESGDQNGRMYWSNENPPRWVFELRRGKYDPTGENTFVTRGAWVNENGVDVFRLAHPPRTSEEAVAVEGLINALRQSRSPESVRLAVSSEVVKGRGGEAWPFGERALIGDLALDKTAGGYRYYKLTPAPPAMLPRDAGAPEPGVSKPPPGVVVVSRLEAGKDLGEYKVADIYGDSTPEEVDAYHGYLSRSPSLVSAVGDVSNGIKADIEYHDVDLVGFTTSAVGGVNIGNTRIVLNLTEGAFYTDSLLRTGLSDLAPEVQTAHNIVSTIIHEMVHRKHVEHTPEFHQLYADLMDKLVSSGSYDRYVASVESALREKGVYDGLRTFLPGFREKVAAAKRSAQQVQPAVPSGARAGEGGLETQPYLGRGSPRRAGYGEGVGVQPRGDVLRGAGGEAPGVRRPAVAGGGLAEGAARAEAGRTEAGGLSEGIRARPLVVRYDLPGATLASDPDEFGRYYSLLKPGEESPHSFLSETDKRVPTEYSGIPVGANVLDVTDSKVVSPRDVGSDVIPGDASQMAIAKLLGLGEYNRLRALSREDIVSRIRKEFPKADVSRAWDKGDLLTAYGSLLTKKRGYDGIVDVGSGEFSEYVALTRKGTPSARTEAGGVPEWVKKLTPAERKEYEYHERWNETISKSEPLESDRDILEEDASLYTKEADEDIAELFGKEEPISSEEVTRFLEDQKEIDRLYKEYASKNKRVKGKKPTVSEMSPRGEESQVNLLTLREAREEFDEWHPKGRLPDELKAVLEEAKTRFTARFLDQPNPKATPDELLDILKDTAGDFWSRRFHFRDFVSAKHIVEAWGDQGRELIRAATKELDSDLRQHEDRIALRETTAAEPTVSPLTPREAEDLNRRLNVPLDAHIASPTKFSEAFDRNVLAYMDIMEADPVLRDKWLAFRPAQGGGLNTNAIRGVSDNLRAAVNKLIYDYRKNNAREFPAKMTYDEMTQVVRDLLGVKSASEFAKKYRAGKGLTFHEIWGLEYFRADILKRIDDEYRIVNDPNASNEAKIGALMEAHRITTDDAPTLQAAVGVASELGRSLSFQRWGMSALDPESRMYPVMMDAWVKAGASREAASRLALMMQKARASGADADWLSFSKELGRVIEPTKLQKYLEFYKGSLMGYPSFVANASSNALFAGLKELENVVGVGLDAVRSTLTGTERTRFLGDTSAAMVGMQRALREWMPNFGQELKDAALLKPFKMTGTMEDFDLVKFPPKIQGWFGEVARFPYKIMNSTDSLFKHVARSMEWHRIANRYLEANSSARTGNRAADITGLVNEMIADYNQKISTKSVRGLKWAKAIAQADKAAEELTFQKELGTTGKAIQSMLNNNPWAQFFFPFYKTPTNIFKETIKRTPLGFAWAVSRYREAKKLGTYDPAAMVDDFVKPAVGSMVMASTAMLALSDIISGKGPQDPEQAEAKKATGWQPYSIDFAKLLPWLFPPGMPGSMWVSYQRMEPVSSILGMAADFIDMYKAGDINSGGKAVQAMMASADQNFLNKTFWSTLEGMISASSDPVRYGPKFLKNLQAQFIPNVVGPVPFGHLARAIDPNYRETHALGLSPFFAKVPGLSMTLPAQKTPLGEARERPGGTGVERLFSPFARSAGRAGPEAEAGAELARIQWAPTRVQDSVKLLGKKVYFTEGQREALAKAQQQATEEFSKLIKTKYYQSLPDNEDESIYGQSNKRKEAQRVFDEARRLAMSSFRADLYARLRRKEYTPGKVEARVQA